MLKRAALLALVVIVVSGMCFVVGAQENAATVHGTVYYWFTLEPLNNSIIEVNTIPRQTYVATDGQYSFQLPQGDYTITASYWQDNVLLYFAEENLTILGEGGDYVVDLLAFPIFDENGITLDNDLVPDIEPDDTENIDNGTSPDIVPNITGNVLLVVSVVGVVVISVVVVFYYRRTRMKKKPAEVKTAEASASIKVVGLPEDLQSIVEKIREAGGRMNQLELRQKLPYSEAKVSLMLADLESRGLIRKIKKGRGNIIILKES
jgi:uncharacterized membrane protein